MKNKAYVITAIAMACAAQVAGAQTFSNAATETIQPFGEPDTTTYGQVFQLTAGAVSTSWTFYATSGNAGNVRLLLAGWDGQGAVGPALYTSSAVHYAGGEQSVHFGGINTALAAGTYVAAMTVWGVDAPLSSVTMAGSSSDGGLAGGFSFLNSAGASPLDQMWEVRPAGSWGVPHLQYTAVFAPVPEPASVVLMLAGLGVVVGVARRRASR